MIEGREVSDSIKEKVAVRVQRYKLREHADKLLAEADAMAHDPNFSWAEHGEKLDRTLAEYRAASDAWLAAVLEERGKR